MTREYRSWFQDLINVWTMLATMLKNKVIRGNSFTVSVCKLKILYMFRTFVSSYSGQTSYNSGCGSRSGRVLASRFDPQAVR